VKEEPWILKEEVKRVVRQAISSVSNLYDQNSTQQQKLLKIPHQFEMAYEGIFSLLNIGALRVNKEKPITLEQIENNLQKMKLKLSINSTSLAQQLALGLRNISASNLEWNVPLANCIIDDSSDLVNNLKEPAKKTFLKPARQMVPPSLSLIREMLKDILNNLAFGPGFADSLNEGTYVTNVIVPLICATLKNLSYRKSSFISTYERQSIASKNRKGEDKTGR
ncbi:15039_t:CDS:2, partial [Entrophospora sp. SA101]